MDHADAVQPLQLYGTSGCHLCEEAERVLQVLALHLPGLSWENVDISAVDHLFERYGLRIPVLANPQGDELDWPFDPARVVDWLGRRPA